MEKKKKIQLQILKKKEHSDKVVTRMTSHVLQSFENDPEDEKPFVVTLFVAVCRASSASSLSFSSSAMPAETYVYSSSLSNRKLKNNL